MALVLYFDEIKYMFQTNLLETVPRNCVPKFILVQLQEINNYQCSAQFAWIPLGRLGSSIDKNRYIKLNILFETQEREMTCYQGQPIMSIEECLPNELYFHQFDFYDVNPFSISLSQENIEETKVENWLSEGEMMIGNCVTELGNPGYESTAITRQILKEDGEFDNVSYSNKINKNGECVESAICIFNYDEDGKQQLVDTFNSELFTGKSISLVNQQTSEIFIMNLGGKNHSFYKCSPFVKSTTENEELPSRIEKVHFENYEKFNLKSSALISCQLTASKYLILIHSEDNHSNTFIQKTYQDLFTKRIIWLLVDLSACRVKRVYPRVYDLANIVKKQDGEFMTVRKSSRRGKVADDCPFLDGDLNGGYSDPSLLSAIKPVKVPKTDFKAHSKQGSKSGQIDQKSTTSIPLPENYQLGNSKLFAFRPFSENPDLFQVNLFMSSNITVHCDDKPLPIFGQLFTFYFKFRDEATLRYSKLLTFAKSSQFTDIIIKSLR